MDMSIFIFPSILLGLLLIAVVIFLIFSNKQKKNASIDKEEKVGKKSNSSMSNSYKKEIPREDVFKFMDFEKIVNNMIVQNNGTKFTMAVRCKGINYDLMSEVEQLAVEEGFITFLNTLRYPIQLYVQAQNIDLKSAINTYKKNVQGVKEEFDVINKEYTNLIDRFDADQKEIERLEEQRSRVLNVYEYADDIINYVERLSLNKSLLQRNFYVLVSYYTTEITAADNFSKEELINLCYNELLTRAQTIISALSACSVSGEVLTSNELADLLYTAYNRDDKGLLNVKEAIESGFYRLYSTSEDVFLKKQEKLQEQIQVEAQYRAIDAIKKAIEEGNYIPPEAEKLDTIDKISKTAAEYVKNEKLPNDIKEKAKEILVEEYKKDREEIIENSTLFNNLKGIENEKNDGEKEVEEVASDESINKSTNKKDILDDRFELNSNDVKELKKDKEENNQDSNSSDEDDLII